MIRRVIKSSIDTNTVLQLLQLLCQPPQHTHTHTYSHTRATQCPPGHIPSLFMVLPPLSDNKRSRRPTRAQPAVCLAWRSIHSLSPATIKRNLSLNKKVTPYLLRLTMMKGNEDKGSSCRYQYKYYWKVN